MSFPYANLIFFLCFCNGNLTKHNNSGLKKTTNQIITEKTSCNIKKKNYMQLKLYAIEIIFEYKATNMTSVLSSLLLSMYSAVFSCFLFSQWKETLKYSFALDSTSVSVIIIYFCLANSFCPEQAHQNWRKTKECNISQKFTETSQIVHDLTLPLSEKHIRFLFFISGFHLASKQSEQ